MKTLRRVLVGGVVACALVSPVIAETPGLSETVILRVQLELLLEQNQQLQALLRRAALEQEAGCVLNWTVNPPVCVHP